ncbi:MAG: phosphate acyltransferase PlsX [Dehalococcoidia bacterium]|nr:phosphate acyltransferase PlsX [Dehalococcoidia bacterium]
MAETKTTIAVDAAGGDYAPQEVVKGAIRGGEEYGVNIILVGKKAILHVLAARYLKQDWLTIVEANEVIEFNEHPMRAVVSKPNSSIVVGVNLVKQGVAQAFMSAGHTGAMFGASMMILGKKDGIERPAICAVLDITGSTPVVLIDVGANADCKPHYLVQFAEMGIAFARRVLGVKSPRVALLNIGEEDTKGNRLAQDSFVLLKDSGLNFIGNVEGHDLSKRKADVVVTDGFTGNIVLKTLEGMGDVIQNIRELGNAGTKNVRGRALLHLVGIDSWARRMDYREYGGACLLGVNGNIIIAHGRSRAGAIKNAIGLAKQTVEGKISDTIEEERHE